jgi:poly-beta-1,6-N-acetyl-D-glucosamine synthase
VTEPDRAYVLISPCRNEARHMRRTLDSVVAQSLPPALWVVVDDGSTDETPAILADYAARHDWIRIVPKPDRGHRAVGPGVIEAFYAGLDTVDLARFPYLCKLDLDLDLPPRYFETLIARMEADPRIGTCSGKPYVRRSGQLVSERRGDEMSVGMTKFYRRECFDEIGGFVREVMWDAIDCHKARQLGWIAVSWDDADLRFEHLRPMGRIPLKNSRLIEGHRADSIPPTGGRNGDDGTEAGSAGGIVLRVLAGGSRPPRSPSSVHRPVRRPERHPRASCGFLQPHGPPVG